MDCVKVNIFDAQLFISIFQMALSNDHNDVTVKWFQWYINSHNSSRDSSLHCTT